MGHLFSGLVNGSCRLEVTRMKAQTKRSLMAFTSFDDIFVPLKLCRRKTVAQKITTRLLGDLAMKQKANKWTRHKTKVDDIAIFF